MKTGKYDKNGCEMMVGDIVHFRCKSFSLSGRGEVFLQEKRIDEWLGEEADPEWRE